MKFSNASEILRSYQKDDLYSKQLSDETSDVLLKILGSRLWIRYKDLFESSAQFAYFLLTTLAGYQVRMQLIVASLKQLFFFRPLVKSTVESFKSRNQSLSFRVDSDDWSRPFASAMGLWDWNWSYKSCINSSKMMIKLYPRREKTCYSYFHSSRFAIMPPKRPFVNLNFSGDYVNHSAA